MKLDEKDGRAVIKLEAKEKRALAMFRPKLLTSARIAHDVIAIFLLEHPAV